MPSEIRVAAMKKVRNFLIDESGSTAIEYGLMSAIIFVGLLAALTTFNGNIVDYYESIGAAMMAAFGTTD